MWLFLTEEQKEQKNKTGTNTTWAYNMKRGCSLARQLQGFLFVFGSEMVFHII